MTERKYDLDNLIELAKEIENDKLREKTIDLLNNPKLSNDQFSDWEPISWEECPGGPETFHHGYPGGLVDHVYSVTSLAIKIAEHVEDVYDVDIDMDVLTSAALLHDIGKLNEWRYEGEVIHSGTPLDHTVFGTAELYAQGFPHHVIHCVASHGGDVGTTEPSTIEARILHEADSFDANTDHELNPQTMEDMVVLGPEDLE